MYLQSLETLEYRSPSTRDTAIKESEPPGFWLPKTERGDKCQMAKPKEENGIYNFEFCSSTFMNVPRHKVSSATALITDMQSDSTIILAEVLVSALGIRSRKQE